MRCYINQGSVRGDVVVTRANPRVFDQRSHINPANRFSKHKKRTIDASNPDDWWGTTTVPPRGSDTASATSTVEEPVSGSSRRYYYHECHYIHYTRASPRRYSRRMKTSMGPETIDEEGRLEAARLAFVKAQECTDSSEIAHQIQEVALHCGSDVVKFALVIGVISKQDCTVMTEGASSRKQIEKTARRCIVMAFHPDLVDARHRRHKHPGGEESSPAATLGHCIVQTMNNMSVV